MMLELNKIYNMDCIEGMKQLDDNSIDLVLTDPPYGINVMTRKKVLGRGSTKCKVKDLGEMDWDIKPNKECFKEIFRISKNQIIFGGNYFELPVSSCWIVWDKLNGNSDFADCELAWTSFNTAVRKFSFPYGCCDYWNHRYFEKRIHPTQKPVALIREILKRYSNENDIVLDCFMGSGTTALACKQLNRHFIGFEINEDYYDISIKRLLNVPERLDNWFEK